MVTSPTGSDVISSTDSSKVPPIAVHEVGNKLKNKKKQKTKTMGPDNINSIMLKLAISYAVESLTYIYNLCIQQNISHLAQKADKVVPLPKAKGATDKYFQANFAPI